MGFPARSFPFMENPAPHRAEYNNAGHMEGPTGKAEFTHLGFAHGVEEKLKIPSDSRNGRKDVVAQTGNVEIQSGLRLRQGGDGSVAILADPGIKVDRMFHFHFGGEKLVASVIADA